MTQFDLDELDRRLAARQAVVTSRRQAHLVQMMVTTRRHPNRVALAEFDDPGWEPRSLAFGLFVSDGSPDTFEEVWDEKVILTRHLRLFGNRARDAEKIAECLLQAFEDDVAVDP